MGNGAVLLTSINAAVRLMPVVSRFSTKYGFCPVRVRSLVARLLHVVGDCDELTPDLQQTLRGTQRAAAARMTSSVHTRYYIAVTILI